MRLIARTLLPLMMLFCASVSGHAQESYKEWWKFLQGEWEYTISSPLDETGTATWRIAAKRSALVLRTVAENGVVGMELCGWQADKKRLLANGYASDGSCWTIESTKISRDQIEGENYGALPDGKSFKGRFIGKRVGPDHYEWTFTGKDGEGNPLTMTGKYKRKK